MLFSGRYPDRFHRPRVPCNYFEGWYFKLVDAAQERVWAIIPGVMYGVQRDEDHSFIQVVRGETREYSYLTYSATDFEASPHAFRFKVGENVFSGSGFRLQLKDQGLDLSGELRFTRIVPWPDTFLKPGSMGFWNYVPNMQCYSQVCAMDLDLQGSLYWGEQEMDFSGGKGYIEKNWGQAFPYAWVWVQSNHFGDARASVSCSLGLVPVLGTRFRGFLLGLTVNGGFFSFTTMNRSRCRVWPREQGALVEAWNKRHLLTMATLAPEEGFIELKGPRQGQMVPLVRENLSGQVKVEVKNRNGEILFAGIGTSAGIEYGGDQQLILEPQPY